jgi:hypothetical protein
VTTPIEPNPAADRDGVAAEPRPPVPPPPGPTTPLLDYVRANRDAYTEDSLRRAALAAGNAPADVDAAIAAARRGEPQAADRGRAARTIFLWYLGVFVVLTVLMAVNQANAPAGRGEAQEAGIRVLAISMGAAFVASLVWIASRRAFVAVIGALVAIAGLGSLVSSFSSSSMPSGLVQVAVGIAIILAAARLRARPGVPARPSMELLMVLPMLTLLAVGGICVASGLPIPQTR